MSLLREYIKHIITEQLKPEAPTTAPAEEYLFSDERSKAPTEENTEVEKELLSLLNLHYMHTKPLDKKNAELIESWMTKGWYENIIKSPSSKIYRGFNNISHKDLTAFLGKEPDQANGRQKVSTEYQPKSFVSSWTIDYEQAFEFAFSKRAEFTKPNTFNVILVSHTNDTRTIMNPLPGGIYSISEFESFEEEQEVFSLGSVKINEVMYMKV